MSKYEIRFGYFDSLASRYNLSRDTIIALHEKDAVNKLSWKYGELIDIISIHSTLIEENDMYA